MVKKIIFTPVPLWTVGLVIVFMSAGTLVALSFFQKEVMNYALMVSPVEKKELEGLSYGEQPSLSDPDFFKRIKNEFVMQKANFIEADLSEMRVRVYQEGVLAREVPILTKGKEGSWWETPSGIYKIASKEEDHFSSFGKVHQPWSMAFQGNFFIHGWPYYPDGTPVASTYSGGCIRLSNEDAKIVYDLSIVGMPVLVFKKEFTPDDFSYQVQTPSVSASHYIIADLKSNFVFKEKASSEVISLGPFEQFISSLVATDYINIEKEILLDEDMLEGTDEPLLVPDRKTTPYDLLHLTLLSSSESPTNIFANYLGKKRFITLSNEKARGVGMNKTSISFVVSASSTVTASSSFPETFEIVGKSKENVTTAEDLFYLAKYLYNNRKFILDVSSGRRTNTIYAVSPLASIENKNIFYSNPNFVGGKAVQNSNGTESFWGVFMVKVHDEKRPVFIFLKDSLNVKDEVTEWLTFIQEAYY